MGRPTWTSLLPDPAGDEPSNARGCSGVWPNSPWPPELSRTGASSDAKHLTNDLECRFAEEFPAGPPRPINLDPGYVESSKLVLASMKNFSHRIYMDRGVYAEVTLMYRKGDWQSLEWTFPDFASPRYWEFLDSVRERLKQQLLQKPQEPRT